MIRSKLPFALLVLVFILTKSVVAQDSVSDKLKDVKGDVSKITITTENGDVVFDGDDAKKLFGDMKMSSGKGKKFKFFSSGSDDDSMKKKKVIILDSDDNTTWSSDDDDEFDVMVFDSDDDEDFDWDDDSGIKKEIRVNIEDGKKKVTVTTNENGEEKTEVFEGEEAEEYLKKHESGEMKIRIEKPGKDKKVKKIIIEKKMSDDSED